MHFLDAEGQCVARSNYKGPWHGDGEEAIEQEGGPRPANDLVAGNPPVV